MSFVYNMQHVLLWGPANMVHWHVSLCIQRSVATWPLTPNHHRKKATLRTLSPSCKNRNFGDNAVQEPFAALGHRIQPASTTTKVMRKQFGRGRPHQIRQPNDRECHSIKFTAVTLVIQIPALTEIRCAV